MASDGGVAAKLAGARKALDNANNSNVSAKASPFAPKAQPKPATAPTDYSHARKAREDAGHEFMGVKSDQAPELNAALKSREDAKKELDQ